MSERQVRAGFMNIPTTFPAPQIEGFFVSGAGAGLKIADGELPNGAVFPGELGALLSRHGYVLDLRLMASGIDELGEFVARQVNMEERRTDSFLAC